MRGWNGYRPVRLAVVAAFVFGLGCYVVEAASCALGCSQPAEGCSEVVVALEASEVVARAEDVVEVGHCLGEAVAWTVLSEPAAEP